MTALDTMKSALQCSKTEAASLRIRVRQLEEKIIAMADASELEAAKLRQGAEVLITENARLVAAVSALLKQLADVDSQEQNTRLREEAALYKQRYQEKAAESQTWAAKAGAHAAENTSLKEWLRRLVDADCDIEVTHGSVCAGKPPSLLDGKCPACMWLLAAGHAREALGLPRNGPDADAPRGAK